MECREPRVKVYFFKRELQSYLKWLPILLFNGWWCGLDYVGLWLLNFLHSCQRLLGYFYLQGKVFHKWKASPSFHPSTRENEPDRMSCKCWVYLGTSFLLAKLWTWAWTGMYVKYRKVWKVEEVPLYRTKGQFHISLSGIQQFSNRKFRSVIFPCCWLPFQTYAEQSVLLFDRFSPRFISVTISRWSQFGFRKTLFSKRFVILKGKKKFIHNTKVWHLAVV